MKSKEGVRMKYDLIVIGGGFAGVASAISAAKEGMRTLLVEKSNSLGGAATNCLVNPFMPNSTKIDGKMVDFSMRICDNNLGKLLPRNEYFMEE